MKDLIHIPEPRLLFKHNQAMEDPRDGLTLFGPLDEGKPYGVRAGIIGTKGGIHRFKKWATKIQYPISNSPPQYARPIFPGFEAVFRIPFNPDPAIELEVSEQTLAEAYLLDDRHQRVYKTVETYSTKIAKAINEEESDADIWFVVIPDEVYRYCRPKSYVEAELRITSSTKM